MSPNRHSSTIPLASFPTESVQANECRRLVATIIERWRGSQPGDSRQVFGEHPELTRYRSLVLDLIYEEFCRRRELGEAVDEQIFCDRFPTYRNSVARMLEVHGIIEQNPHLSSAEASWPKAGEIHRGFEILEELGRGTLARAYLARESALGGRLVVIKLAYAGAYEAATLGKLLHPNIVRIHSVQSDAVSGQSLICMAFHGRATLADVLDQVFAVPFPPRGAKALLEASRAVSHPAEPADESQPDSFLLRANYVNGVAFLGAQLADALAYTHSRGICHRDLKPSNILLTTSGCPMLLDFNLSSDQHSTIPRVGGTLPFMAAEQIESAVLCNSSSPALDQRSDLFSLGVVLYQMLCRTLPFGVNRTGLSMLETANTLISQQRLGPAPVRAHSQFVDQELAGIIDRCLKFSPDDRPASADELAKMLRGCLTARRRVARWAEMHRPLIGVATVCLLLAGVASGVALATRDPYEIRAFHQALRSIERKDYDSALSSLNKVLEIRPDFADAYVARGNVFRLREEFGPAEADYNKSLQIRVAPDTLISDGYCLTCLNRPQFAVGAYERARGLGCNTAALFNNLGYNLIKLNKYIEAKSCFDKALQIDERLQAAYHNRAFLSIKDYLNLPQRVPLDGIRDIRRAIQLGPVHGELFFHAARLYALAARRDATWIKPGIEALGKSIELGLKFDAVKADPIFRPLRGHPGFDDLRQCEPGPASRFVATRVVAPL